MFVVSFVGVFIHMVCCEFMFIRAFVSAMHVCVCVCVCATYHALDPTNLLHTYTYAYTHTHTHTHTHTYTHTCTHIHTYRLQGQLQGSQPEPVHIKDDHLAVQLAMSVLSAAAEMSFSFSGQNPWLEGVDDLTPNASPLNSPCCPGVSRIDTVVNTRPMIKLAADELVKKVGVLNP